MSKIAVIDSGFGGLTVLSALKRVLPGEDYIYYGDSAHAPYGEKTPEELRRLNKEICKRLLSRDDIKCFVVACNTTTSEALDKIKEDFPEHDFVGIEPAVDWAAEEMPGKNILVLATTATINGEKLKKRIAKLNDRAHITALAAPGIVPYVESGRTETREFTDYLERLTEKYRKDTDAVVLGCTHFPFVREKLKACFDKNISFYDAAILVAERVKGLLTEKKEINETVAEGSIDFLNSDASKIENEEKLLNELLKRDSTKAYEYK